VGLTLRRPPETRPRDLRRPSRRASPAERVSAHATPHTETVENAAPHRRRKSAVRTRTDEKLRKVSPGLVVKRDHAPDSTVGSIDTQPRVRRAVDRVEVTRDPKPPAGRLDVGVRWKERHDLSPLWGRAPWAEPMLRLDRLTTAPANHVALSLIACKSTLPSVLTTCSTPSPGPAPSQGQAP
jgi:hypothetical protein